MASVSDSDISEAESIMLDRDEGTSLRGRLGVGPPGCCSEDEAVAPNPKSAIFFNSPSLAVGQSVEREWKLKIWTFFIFSFENLENYHYGFLYKKKE